MSFKSVFIVASFFVLISSCVSKKKYNELQQEYSKTYGQLQKINARVEAYYQRINSLSNQNQNLTTANSILTEENANKFDYINNVAVLSKNQRKQLAKTLEKVNPEKLKNASTLEDSINVALSHNLSKNLSDDEGVDIQIDNTVVMITVADKLLFQPGSYTVNKDSKKFLEKLAVVINSEPTIDVIVEGHTDATPVRKSKVKDNWELSVQRATSIVRELQDRYKVDPSKLTAAGRSSYQPIADNSSIENRALNRRIRIVLVPDLDKFFALLTEQENINL